jgi:hypothetical protein
MKTVILATLFTVITTFLLFAQDNELLETALYKIDSPQGLYLQLSCELIHDPSASSIADKDLSLMHGTDHITAGDQVQYALVAQKVRLREGEHLPVSYTFRAGKRLKIKTNDGRLFHTKNYEIGEDVIVIKRKLSPGSTYYVSSFINDTISIDNIARIRGPVEESGLIGLGLLMTGTGTFLLTPRSLFIAAYGVAYSSSPNLFLFVYIGINVYLIQKGIKMMIGIRRLNTTRNYSLHTVRMDAHGQGFDGNGYLPVH